MRAVQAHGEMLGFAQLVVIACTATLAAIGAAAIPSAGLVTMIMVLQVQLCSRARRLLQHEASWPGLVAAQRVLCQGA